MSREEYYEKKRNEIIGQTIGHLRVIAYDHSTNGRVFYSCKCELCGENAIVRKDMLISGRTSSCGCIRDKWMHSGNINRKHGLYEDRAYWVWTKIKTRCYNSNSHEYKNYGGRGIKMCEEWLDPKNFIEWAYANGYDKDAPKGQCTLDRIDVNKNYEPSNCRFITNLEQQSNKRTCRKFEYNGEVHTIAGWARIFQIPYSTMAQILKSGKSLDYLNNGYTPRKKR